MVLAADGRSERSPWSYIHRGYVQSWNFTVERKLPQNIVTSVAYVGSHSVHLLADYDINAGSPGSGTRACRIAAQFGRTIATNMWDGYLSSNYHSLQVAVNRSFAQGPADEGRLHLLQGHRLHRRRRLGRVGWNWAPVFQRNRAVAGFDRAQNLQIGWLYELPFGKGKTLAKSGAAAAAGGSRGNG